SYNIDLEHPLVFRGPKSSFFGYSVLEHYHDNTRWVIVGAPRANSTFSSSARSPGAVYKCRVHSNPERRCTEMDLGRDLLYGSIRWPGNKRRESCGKTCQGDRDDEWMGVSLARQDGGDGRILACAHRWKNVYYDSEHILPHGYCSVIPSTLQGRTKPLIPCYEGTVKAPRRTVTALVMGLTFPIRGEFYFLPNMLLPGSRRMGPCMRCIHCRPKLNGFLVTGDHDYKQKYGEEHGSCQAGIAGVFMEELVVMGAPGSYYWTGTIKVYNLTSKSFYSPNKEDVDSHRYSYLGYSVTAGHFSAPNTIDIAAGAPQHSGSGKVYIFKIDGSSLVKSFQASGKMMGSYFGSSLCAVDLNQDGLSDLLVGAPMHSQLRDEGQVTVYLSKGNGVMEKNAVLSGDNAFNAHFGECIAAIGDIDDDGFQDVAVGAPKEDDYGGAVYIYHGDATGIISTYSLKLTGRSVNPGLQMFGQSISGNVDMDGNGYADVTVGAFVADSVVLLRTRPVVTVDVSIFLPVSINITVPQCHEGLPNTNCFNVSVCMRFRGRQLPGLIELLYNLTADVGKRERSQPSRAYFTQNGSQISQLSQQLRLDINKEECRRYTAYVKPLAVMTGLQTIGGALGELAKEPLFLRPCSQLLTVLDVELLAEFAHRVKQHCKRHKPLLISQEKITAVQVLADGSWGPVHSEATEQELERTFGLGTPHVAPRIDTVGLALAFRHEFGRGTEFVDITEPPSKKDVKDVFAGIAFEVAYGLGKHVLAGHQQRDLPALTPVLRWRKGQKIAVRNETWFEKNCLSDDCAADLRLQGKLLLSGLFSKPHLALGGVKNVSLNLTISNTGDDAYDTNIYFNFSREVFYINFWQKEEKGISCGLVDLDFLKCSVGFPFMRAQTKYHFAVIFDTSQLSGENDTLQFLVRAKSANPEHKLSDNALDLSVSLIHETDTTITGVVTPSSFMYGNSIEASRFVQLEDMKCNFQPLNLTFQAINKGPSRLPGSTVDIRIPNRLVGNGADMFHIIETQVTDGRGNCTPHRNPTPCTIPQDKESIFHSIFAFFTKSGRRVVDCDRPGRACMTISCSLGPQLKEEALSIDIKLLLNTEILKTDSSSVIQFVTRGSVQVNDGVLEVQNGLSEDFSLVFEALHSQEPRGYVVGWIIAISLLVGILIFLLLAVLLWKGGGPGNRLLRYASGTDDEELHVEMSSLLESVAVSGQHVLLAAQKLSLQPALPEHREELIAATQRAFLGVVKVLIADDDAAVRRVIAAADGVLRSLAELGSSSRQWANALQDSHQAGQLLGSLETLRRCISMLHTAMCAAVKHPTNEQALQAKSYILDKIQSTVRDIGIALKNQTCGGLPGPCGYYSARRDALLQLLSRSSISEVRESSFDSVVRDLVFHCMAVANSSRGCCQRRLVGHCRHVLHMWSDVRRLLKSPEEPAEHRHDFESHCTLLGQHVQMLDGALTTAVLYQALDTFMSASSAVSELLNVTRQILAGDANAKTDLNLVQPLLQGFTSRAQRITRAAYFVSALAADAKSVERVENSRTCLGRLAAQIAALSPELAARSAQVAGKLEDTCLKWEEETAQLVDAASHVVGVRELASVALAEMADHRRGCDQAYRERRCEDFHGQAATLLCHMRMVSQSVRRHVERSHDPVHRNGLLVLLKQAQASQNRVAQSVGEALSGPEVYATFSDNVSVAIEHFRVLREGLDGQQHPHLLSPLREAAREANTSQTRLPGEDASDRLRGRSESPGSELSERDPPAEDQKETTEAEPAHKYDKDDLDTPAVSGAPTLIPRALEVDLLPLVYDVVTVTKAKDVTLLNQVCTSLLELSNCYVQSAKEAAAIVGAADGQTLERFRAELVSLTPLLVQTARETAMSAAVSPEMLYKHGIRLSDLINNTRQVLLPAAGNWYQAVYTELRGRLPAVTTTVRKQLNQVMELCTDTVQLLTSSDFTFQSDQEPVSALHNKLKKAQIRTRSLVDFSSWSEKPLNQLDGLCVLWALSVQAVLNSVDRILGTSMDLLGPQKQLRLLSENSLRIQEALRLTCLNSRSPHKSRQLTAEQEELRALTEGFLKAAAELQATPSVSRLAESEFFQRKLLIKIKVLVSRLSKANRDYDSSLRHIISTAVSDSSGEEAEGGFEEAAQTLFDRVKLACKKVEDSLHYVRDPRARSDMRSVNDHLSFQISDLISRARLVAEAPHVCDALSLDVLVQCWSAKAHYVLEEIRKQDGIHPETKEQIRAGLQGRALDYVKDVLATSPAVAQRLESGEESRHKVNVKHAKTAEPSVNPASKVKHGPEHKSKDSGDRTGAHREAFTLTDASIFLRQESDSWEPEDNRIVQVTRKMADTIFHMSQYLRKKGPIPNKETFVGAAKDVMVSCQSVTQFIRVIANHSLDKQCADELSLIVDQILTISNQLSIISRSESDLREGLKQPEPESDGAEATAVCFQWRRKLEVHRAQESTNPDTDELGLRKTSSHPVAPSLAPPGLVTTPTPSKHKQLLSPSHFLPMIY
ncbi:unnamed protein product, partial [Tetraodon nigroviridis]